MRFPRPSPRCLLQAAALLGLALAAGTLANRAASGTRKLGWFDHPLPPAQAAPLPATAAPAPSTSPVPEPPAPDKPPIRISPSVVAKPSNPFPADPANPVREINGAEARRAQIAGLPFLDARSTSDFQQGHIAGAWSIPIWQADADERITIFEATARPGSQDAIVLYCSGGDCEDSHMLASRLMKLGYRNLLIYRAGYPDWEQHGWPVRVGEQP